MKLKILAALMSVSFLASGVTAVSGYTAIYGGGDLSELFIDFIAYITGGMLTEGDTLGQVMILTVVISMLIGVLVLLFSGLKRFVKTAKGVK